MKLLQFVLPPIPIYEGDSVDVIVTAVKEGDLDPMDLESLQYVVFDVESLDEGSL